MGLGKQIARYRGKAGWTLEMLEERSGVAAGTIHALEKRDSSRSEKFPAIARAFGLTVEQLGDETYDYEIDPNSDRPASWGDFGDMPSFSREPGGSAPATGSFARGSPPSLDDEPTPQHRGIASRVADRLLGRVAHGMAPILAWEHEGDLPPGEFVMIPRLDVHLSAGAGRDQVEIEFTKAQPQAFRAEWIRERRLKPNKLAAMTASGDSMEPGIFDGDSLLIDTSQTNVVDGKVYALWYDGGERVKRLFRLPGGGLRIKSDNPEHGSIELGPDYSGHVRVLGRVVHRSGTGGL
jgi:transcriptional regulator with XRE-family HTH domain